MEAAATITNTMMVVIVVSRRVGQVTLAVSERTSCRNLNGLKAIVGTPDVSNKCQGTEQPISAQPSFRRMSRQAGSNVRGFLNCRAGDPSQTGRLRVARYVLPHPPDVKLFRNGPGRRRPGGLD